MTETKEIVCLANSRKHLHRCVAGIESLNPDGFGWVRPVTDRAGHGVSFPERRLPDGSEPAVLDLVIVGVLKPRPEGFQPENWLLDDTVPWQKTGQVGWDALEFLQEKPSTLWLNGFSSSYGQNDRVAQYQVAGRNCLGARAADLGG